MRFGQSSLFSRWNLSNLSWWVPPLLLATASCAAAGANDEGGVAGPDGPGFSPDEGAAEPGDPADPADPADLSDPNNPNPAPGVPDPDEPETLDEYCNGSGPPIELGDTQDILQQTCTSALAAQVFSHAVCSCTDAVIAGFLETRPLDTGAPPDYINAGAPVGINGNYAADGYGDVGGHFTVAGTDGLGFLGYFVTGGDLKVASAVSVTDLGFTAGYIDVGRDAAVNGNIVLFGYANVGRDLVQPAGALPPLVANVTGQRVVSPVNVADPCKCQPDEIVDIAALVDDAAITNDNNTVQPPLDPALLTGVVGLGIHVTLPCGRFYLNAITGVGDINLHITGRTALFVAGDVASIGHFNVEIDPGGELDLFIKGNLVSIGAGSFGSKDRPAASRVYVAGTGDVLLVGADGFVGNVYAPRANIRGIGATTVYGSLFGNNIIIPGYLSTRYDLDILDDECGPKLF